MQDTKFPGSAVVEIRWFPKELEGCLNLVYRQNRPVSLWPQPRAESRNRTRSGARSSNYIGLSTQRAERDIGNRCH